MLLVPALAWSRCPVLWHEVLRTALSGWSASPHLGEGQMTGRPAPPRPALHLAVGTCPDHVARAEGWPRAGRGMAAIEHVLIAALVVVALREINDGAMKGTRRHLVVHSTARARVFVDVSSLYHSSYLPPL